MKKLSSPVLARSLRRVALVAALPALLGLLFGAVLPGLAHRPRGVPPVPVPVTGEARLTWAALRAEEARRDRLMDALLARLEALEAEVARRERR